MLAQLIATPVAIAAIWCGMAKLVEGPPQDEIDGEALEIYEGCCFCLDTPIEPPPLYCPPGGGPHPDRTDDTHWCDGAPRDVRLSNAPLIPASVQRIPRELIPFSYCARAR